MIIMMAFNLKHGVQAQAECHSSHIVGLLCCTHNVENSVQTLKCLIIIIMLQGPLQTQ
jgi:hypothetical protein